MIHRIKKIFNKYSRALIKLQKAKLIWKKPIPSDVLIFDRGFDVNLLFEYIEESKSAILCIRGEEINIPVLFRSAFNINRYIDYYIKYVKPNFIVTYTDNTKLFYKLKSKHPNIIFIFLQNGLRTKLGDIFAELKGGEESFEVDYMLTFNQAVGDEYCKYIKGKSISIGSARNNLFSDKSIQNINKDILYISAFKPFSKSEEEHWIMFEGKSIKWSTFFQAEKLLVKYLSRYCSINEKKLTVLARSKGSSSIEYKFYKSAIQECNWNYIPNTGKSFSYSLMNDAEFIVGIDSTLLFESFGLGKKTAFFTCRGDIIGASVSQFGWPVKLGETGPFWSNYINKIEFDRVMNYIMNVDNEEWMSVHKRYAPYIMDYDSGNKKLVSLFKDMGLPLNKKNV
jgi:surface carbohydrate biosynthesis protein